MLNIFRLFIITAVIILFCFQMEGSCAEVDIVTAQEQRFFILGWSRITYETIYSLNIPKVINYSNGEPTIWTGPTSKVCGIKRIPTLKSQCVHCFLSYRGYYVAQKFDVHKFGMDK